MPIPRQAGLMVLFHMLSVVGQSIFFGMPVFSSLFNSKSDAEHGQVSCSSHSLYLYTLFCACPRLTQPACNSRESTFSQRGLRRTADKFLLGMMGVMFAFSAMFWADALADVTLLILNLINNDPNGPSAHRPVFNALVLVNVSSICSYDTLRPHLLLRSSSSQMASLYGGRGPSVVRRESPCSFALRS